MRVIAGSKRGMRLLSPKGGISRPIIDRLKESLFSVLYKYGLPEGAMVADLFCGVGSLGIEALSRGADFVSFVERDRRVAGVLERNIEKAGFADCSKVIKADAFKIGAAAGKGKYDLVFIDPPYKDTSCLGRDSPLAGLLNLLGGQAGAEGIVVIRTHRDTRLLERYGRFSLIERRSWGTMAVTILGRGEK